VVCSQVLQQWRQTIPPQIIGFIPGRNPHTPMIHLQFELEKRLIQLDRGKQWQGTTLDLVKCFNLLARWPCKIAMQHCGLPADWAEFWFQSLMGSTRWWKVNDSLSKVERPQHSPRGRQLVSSCVRSHRHDLGQFVNVRYHTSIRLC
jgi:hypothetical protein